MSAGIEVIAQADLRDSNWQDILIKVNRPSHLGNWSYEVIDTKLARETRSGTILQLCLYSELLGSRIWSNSSRHYPDGMMTPAKNPRRSWRKETMIFEEADKRTRKKYTVCSKYWPDGSRFRRRFTNKTLAKNVLSRIEGSDGCVARAEKGTEEPPPEPPQDFTIREFADIYLEEYCNGHVKVTEFTAAHAAFFEKERKKSVAGPTVNRGLAVLSHMFTFALKTKGLIQIHPMARYGRIPEDENAMRVCLCTRADEGPLARSAGTVLCRTQGGRFGMGRVSRLPAFPRESVGHARY
jgi:hypothetical protein